MLFNLEAWLHGLISAFITGGATALSASMIAPETFNFQTGLRKLLEMAAISGVLGAAAYLKNSPLPAIKEKVEAQQEGK